MKQVYKKIIVSILAAAILLAPVAPGFLVRGTVQDSQILAENKALAQDTGELVCNDPNQTKNSEGKIDGTKLCIDNSVKVTNNSATFEATLENTKSPYLGLFSGIEDVMSWNIYDKPFIIEKKITGLPYKVPDGTNIVDHGLIKIKTDTPDQQSFTFSTTKPLQENHEYFMVLQLRKGKPKKFGSLVGSPDYIINVEVTFHTGTGTSAGGVNNISVGGINPKSSDIGPCFSLGGWFDIPNCIAGFLQVIWEGSALIARLGATFLDFFVYYSTNSGSYDNVFVSNGWGAVRDIANIFFIIILLYIAIKTVLGLGASNSKKLVAMVIVVALVINFSLFATRIVIDSTNILAKIFYNSITPVNEKGGDAAPQGIEGQKQISVGIVSTFNPQSLLSNSFKYAGNEKVFIFIQILLIAITLYLTYIFFAVALLFVGRVIALWMAMIFSPFAFASFALPFDIPKLGHKEWWKNLLENALLAPLFIFFLYLVVMFSGFLKDIISYKNIDSLSGTEGLFQRVMSVAIPFIIIAGLLREAKNIAVKYSGEFGEMLHKAGSAVGGMVVGGTIAAATGGAGLALRSTLGKASAAAANSGWAKKWEAKGWGGGTAKRIMESGAKASFDVRNVKVAGQSLASTGLSFMKGQQGGVEGARQRTVEKRRKRAQGLEVGEDEKLKQKLNETERDLQELLKNNTKQIEALDRAIKTAKDNNITTGPNSIASMKAAKKAFMQTLIVATGNNAGKSAAVLYDQAEDEKADILEENRKRKWSYAKTIQGNVFTKALLIRGGKANREAAHKIRMEEKIESKEH